MLAQRSIASNNCNLLPRALKYLQFVHHWIYNKLGDFSRVCSLIIAQLRSPTKFKPCPVAMTRADELTQSGAGVTLHYWPRHRPLSKPCWPTDQEGRGRGTTYDTKYDQVGWCSLVESFPKDPTTCLGQLQYSLFSKGSFGRFPSSEFMGRSFCYQPDKQVLNDNVCNKI